MKKIKIKKPQYILSPWRLTMGVLITWVAGIILGIEINSIITKYIKYATSVQYGFLIGSFILASFLIALPITYLVTYNVMKLINTINKKINQIAEGDYTTRLEPITKSPQINTVVNNFNKMVEQLDSVTVLKNDFISGFSHEFKTPIVLLKGYAELLLESKNLTEEEKEYASIIVAESERLSKLSENTLKLAKLDSQSVMLDVSEFSLDGQIEDCILLLDSALKEKNIEVIAKLEKVKYNSEQNLIKEIWINLLANAIKYGKQNGKIEVTLKKEDKEIVVTVKDDGIGMTSEQTAHVFEKFYQADISHASKGLGLGLTIVKRILEIANGTITCESVENEYTIMTVKLKI